MSEPQVGEWFACDTCNRMAFVGRSVDGHFVFDTGPREDSEPRYMHCEERYLGRVHHLPDCTGFDWQPADPPKHGPIPEGFRLVRNGDDPGDKTIRLWNGSTWLDRMPRNIGDPFKVWYTYIIADATPQPVESGDAPQHCECHERDSSYVCEYCRSQGFRGHMEAAAEKPFRLEVGKFYVARNGKVSGKIERSGEITFPFQAIRNGELQKFRADGTWHPNHAWESDMDLVHEHIPQPESKRMAVRLWMSRDVMEAGIENVVAVRSEIGCPDKAYTELFFNPATGGFEVEAEA